MFITKEFVKKIGSMYNQKPCDDGYKWFVENFPDGAEHKDIFKRAIEDNKISYCTWALSKSMQKEQNVEWAIWCAEKVLPIFETEYPNDDRPRKAIEASKAWLKNPCDETAWAAAKAAEAAWGARTAAKAAEAAWGARTAAVALAVAAAAAAAWAADVTWAAWAASAAEWAAKAAKAAWAADVTCKANHDLSMQILQKGFEIWQTMEV